MRTRLLLVFVMAGLACGARPRAVRAQCPASPTLPGSAFDTRARLASVVDTSRAAGQRFLLRDGTSGCGRAEPAGLEVTPLGALSLLANASLPDSRNDGPLWAGRGANLVVTAGVRVRYRFATLTLAPAFMSGGNDAFDLFPWPDSSRSTWANAYYGPPSSLDYPVRMGSEPVREAHPGESELALAAGPVTLGVSSANQWWGPGIRNALVLSSSGPGIPRVFVRTARPLAVRAGTRVFGWVDARAFAGTVTESRFFLRDSLGAQRSASGLAVSIAPAFDPQLTIGMARMVLRGSDGTGDVLAHALDALTTWEPAPPIASGDTAETDQVTSLFVRWRVPAYGVAVHAEWARHELPLGLGELLRAPDNASAFTFGGEYARTITRGHTVRVQAETTGLDQRIVLTERPPRDFYAGAADARGWTHRGQLLGAWVGPGGSSQWLAADVFAPRWSAGAFVERVRRNNDAFFRIQQPDPNRHDVTLAFGVRGDWMMRWARIAVEAHAARRYSYLFQDNTFLPGTRNVDKAVPGIRATVELRGWN